MDRPDSSEALQVKSVEEGMRSLSEYGEELLSYLPTAILVLNKELKLMSANKAFCEHWQKDLKEIVGKSLGDVLPQQLIEQGRLDARLRQVLDTGQAEEVKDLPYASAHGGERLMSCRMVGMTHTASGQAAREHEVVLLIDDVTEQKHLLDQLKEMQSLSASILEGVPLGIQTVDEGLKVTSVNAGMERIYGLPKEEILGKPLFDLFPGLKTELGEDKLAQAIAKGEAFSIDQLRHNSFKKDLTMVSNIRCAPLRNGAGRVMGLVMMVEDVTDRYTLEQEVSRRERLAMVGQMAAGVAHELNHPLSIISGNLELIKRELEKGEARAEEIDALQEQLARCSEIARDLLGLSRQSEPVRKTVEVNGLLQEVLYLMRAEIRFRNVTVETNLSSRLAKITADPAQLEQVFMNLILNACQAMPRGGRLTIATRNGSHRQGIAIKVANTGQPIPRALLSKLFTPFFTTKPRGQGSGLGLSIAKQIIQSHHGTIHGGRNSNKQTMFTVRLPLR